MEKYNTFKTKKAFSCPASPYPLGYITSFITVRLQNVSVCSYIYEGTKLLADLRGTFGANAPGTPAAPEIDENFIIKRKLNFHKKKYLLNCTAVRKDSKSDEFLEFGETFLGV